MLITSIAMGVRIPEFLLAQIEIEPDPEAAEQAALVFSGPQFFTALIAGVVLAFAFQLLLTNLGVATGISLAGGSSSSSSDDSDESLGSTIRKISFVLGLGTLISVALSLFVACLFAVRLSLFSSPLSGAIVGLVIWGTYFSVMVWVSSTTVGSLVGSVVSTATSGFQALVGTAAAAMGGKAASQQVVATAEAAAAGIRRELTFGLDPVTFKENVEDYLSALRPAQLDIKAIRAEFEDLLDDPNLQEIASSDRLSDIDRATFVNLIGNRTDLSKREVNRLADQLERAWKKAVGLARRSDPLAEIKDYLQSATPDQLGGSELGDKLDALVEEMGRRRKAEEAQNQAPVAQGLMASLNSLTGIVMGRTDLSEVDADKAIAKIQDLKDRAGEQADKMTTQMGIDSPSPVQADIENYLLNAYPWQLELGNIEREFRNVLYDPDADPGAMAAELSQIDRTDFITWLQQRGTSPIFTQAKIRSLANLLDGIRLEVLATAEAARDREASIALLAEVENYLHTTPKASLSPERIYLDFKPLLHDSEADYEQLKTRLTQFDRPTFERILEQRGDLEPVERSAIVNELEIARDRALEESQQVQAAARAKVEEQWHKVQSYLRSTGKAELNPEGIEGELKLLLDDPQTGAAALKERISRFDRDTLVQLLAQRQDLSEEEIEDTLDRVERGWRKVRNAPQTITGKAQEKYEQASAAIADYLRGTGKAELNPEGIKRDLATLFNDPKTGYQAIKHRFARMDRDTLVQLLAQRDDLSEAQINQVIDEVQANLRAIAKAPRRLAQRTQQKARDFKSSVADYLRSTERSELNPEGIQRDVELLLNDPRAGMESLQERLSQFDRKTLVQLLAQRQDLSEEEINRVIDQILEVRDRVLYQLQRIQDKIQGAIDRILAKIRDYLNSLERPELNYEGISSDLRTLFDDPQAGFEALRDRFSQVDRNTLIALLSSRDDLSQNDADRIITQIERTRDRTLQKAERLQQQAIHQLEATKRQAQRQVEETRKAAAVASWWLFLTALVSAFSAAGGGALGVID